VDWLSCGISNAARPVCRSERRRVVEPQRHKVYPSMAPVRTILMPWLLIGATVPTSDVDVAAQAPAALCVELHSLLGEAPKNFRSVRGRERAPALSTERHFEATRLLPGTTDCTVTVRRNGSDYTCASFISEEDELSRRYEELGRDALSCFPHSQAGDESAVRLRPEDGAKGKAVRITVSDRLGVLIRLWTRADTTARPRITLTINYKSG
jgi:hypothetical protein